MLLEEDRAEIDGDTRYEIVDGNIVELSPMGAFANKLAYDLCTLLTNWSDGRHGEAFMEILFRLPGIDRSRRPDAGFLSYGRWPKGKNFPDDEPWEMVPDLAVEVISRTNTYKEIAEKVGEYFRAVVVQVWLVAPWDQQVLVYRSPKDIAIFGREDTLTAEPLLPGFALPLALLFR